MRRCGMCWRLRWGNKRLAGLAEVLRAGNARLRAGNARLRERDAQREAELERVSAELAVLQRLVFGRSSEQARPGAADGHGFGKGLFTNGFIAMLFTERYVAGRSQNSLVTGLARQGEEISAATLAGVCAQAGALLVPLGDAITARSRTSWHLHADETSWHVFAPRDGDGPAKW